VPVIVAHHNEKADQYIGQRTLLVEAAGQKKLSITSWLWDKGAVSKQVLMPIRGFREHNLKGHWEHKYM